MKILIWTAAVLTIFLGSGAAAGAEKISVETGREMFSNPELGGSTNESSCNSCHAGGKGLENAAASKKFTSLVNNCLVSRMEGEKMDGRKVAMRSLKKYIKSLQN